MVFEEREVSSSKEVDEGDTNEEHTREIGICNIRVQTPHGKILRISHIACTENLSTVKMTLQDLLESCMLTQFNFALSFDVSDKATEESTSKDNKSNSITTYNEYTEIGTVLADYLSSPLYTATSEISLEVSELSLKIVYSQYDLKSARTHVKRVRDLLANPPALLGGDNSDSRLTLPSDMTDAIPVSEEMAAPDTAEDESLFVPYPPIDFFVQSSESKLQDFYEETLYKLGQRTVSDGGASSTLVTYASAITVSDFNPPPGPRKMQGDILYLMATFSEGTFHITCCTNGFYVNRTQGDQFDARPTTKHYGSHDLLDVLLCVSPSLKTQWEKHIHSVIKTKNNRKPVFRQTSPLQAIAEHYRSGRSDDICPSQWNIPGLYTTQTVPKTHTRDSWRTQTSLLDAFGMEEKGPPRDWYAYSNPAYFSCILSHLFCLLNFRIFTRYVGMMRFRRSRRCRQ